MTLAGWGARTNRSSPDRSADFPRTARTRSRLPQPGFTLRNFGWVAGGIHRQDAGATRFTWDGITGEYKLPVRLDAGASMTIDVAQLIALNRPGSDGSVIPPGVREGSVLFAGGRGPRQPMDLVLGGGEYNAETATCCPFCIY